MRHIRPKYVLILSLLLLMALRPLHASAQETVNLKQHFLSVNTGPFQIKDEFNYGLVYTGGYVSGEYTYALYRANTRLLFTTVAGLGVDFNKGGGLDIRFRSAEVFYSWKACDRNKMNLFIGPYFLANYNWQVYPQLQSGHMFWYSSLEFGPEIRIDLPLKQKMVLITFSNSFMGWTSRPEPATETTFYSLKFTDFIKNVHSNMQFGSFAMFNHSRLSVDVKNNKRKRLSMGYAFEYFGYFNQPGLHYIAHSFVLRWRVGRINDERRVK